MVQTANIAFRALYILAGLVFIGLAVAESSGKSIQFVPMLFGVLLIVQGASGA